MGRVHSYLLKHFIALFASLFFTLFFITSVIFFIKIASITSVIKINFLELGLLYVYLLPNILIYTLPITFFVALTITLFNLSKENETIVLFTLGYDPKKIAKIFIVVGTLLSTILIINVLVLIPTAKQLNKNFIDYKKAEAKFNIKATEFGQKFSEWFVYIDSNDKNIYNGVVMYNSGNKKDNEKIVTAEGADIKNNKGVLKLKLDEGKIFQIDSEKIEQVNFKQMFLTSEPKINIRKVKDIISYWKEALKNKTREFDLGFLLLIALFPIATILFAIGTGIVTYRYERGSIYPTIIVVIGAYLAIGVGLVRTIGIIGVPIIFLSTVIVSFYFFRKKILLRY